MQSEYGKVILPLVVLRRLDCMLEPTKVAVLNRHADLAGRIENLDPVLQTVAGQQFFNTSPLDFRRVLGGYYLRKLYGRLRSEGEPSR